MSSEPWLIVTPPDSTVGWRSSSVPVVWPASIDITWLRSEDLAQADADASTAAPAIAATRAKLCLAGSRDITMMHLGLELITLGGQVELQAAAAQYRAG